MMQIYVNTVEVYIDEKAAVSLNLINFDIKDISNRSLNYTRDFVVPVAGNELAFGFSASPYTDDDLPYTDFAVQIVSGAYTLLKNGRGWITTISDGYYHITVTDKPGIIQTMKDYGLDQPKTKTYDVSSDSLVKQLFNGTGSAYKIDIIYNEYQKTYAQSNADEYFAKYEEMHLSRYVKHIFEEFATAEGITFTGDLYSDSYFEDFRVLVFSHSFTDNLVLNTSNGVAEKVYDAVVNPSKNFFDLFKEVLKTFGAVFTIEGNIITIKKFDDLNWASPVDWSDKLIKVKSKQFHIPGTSQNNYLRYEAQESAEKTLNQLNLQSNNKNIQFEGDLIKMNASVFPFININDFHSVIASNTNAIFLNDKDVFLDKSVAPTLDINTNKSLDKFVFIIDGSDEVGNGLTIRLSCITRTYVVPPIHSFGTASSQHITAAPDNKTIATYYNSANDYVRIAAMLQNPVFYEAEMFLSTVDMQNFDPFNIASISKLGGNFYVNAIKNYLLSSDKKTAIAELIKVNE